MQSETLAKCVQKFERIAQIIDCNLYHQREKVEDAKSIAMAMVDELRRAEAALSAAEPVMYVSERQLASCVGTYVPSRKTAEGLFQLALYRAPPAPSVAVKALRQAASDFMHLFIQDGHLTVQGLEDTDLIPAYEKLSAALSAQVQDVAGWQSMDTAPKDGSEFAAGRRYSPDGEFVVYTYRWVGEPNYWLSKRNGVCIRPSYQADYKWCPLPAAPAKQEG